VASDRLVASRVVDEAGHIVPCPPSYDPSMTGFTVALWIVGLALEAILLLRGRKIGLLGQFPWFYSYMTYYFSVSLVSFIIFRLRPDLYATSYWYFYLVSLLAEFAVVLEISDHIFEPYLALRDLARFLIICICAAFFVLYVFPSFTHSHPFSTALLDFSLRVSLTKAVAIRALAAAARYYRLRIGRNVAGLITGFLLYLTVYIVNFSAAEKFGRSLYANILRFLGPLGSIVCLAVWAVAMWRAESAPATGRRIGGSEGEALEELIDQVTRFDSLLSRLWRR